MGRICITLKGAIKIIVKCICWKCNKEIEVNKNTSIHNYEMTEESIEKYAKKIYNQREYCNECGKEYKKQSKEKLEQYLHLKAELMIERAVKSMEHQTIKMYDYKNAIETVSEFFLKDTTKFRSSEEVIAAIMLIQNRVSIKVNHKVGKYTVDIMVPTFKCIIEVDGYMHTTGEEMCILDGSRDIEIRNILGKEWEVVRIPTKYINEKAEQLIPAVIAMKGEMQRLREENHGIIPEGFSRRYNALYKKVSKMA